MGRAPCCERTGLKKGPWTPEEDEKLVSHIKKHGQGNWRTLPSNAGLERCGKSCRLRWINYLRPDIKRGRFSFEEEEAIIQLHCILGNKWSAIAARLPGRTDNEIKNYWNTHIRKRLLRMGIDPITHAPRIDLLDLSSLLKPAAAYYPTQADLDTLRALEPLANFPDLVHLASALLSPHAPTSAGGAEHQLMLLPWLAQAQMAAQQAAAMAQHAPPPQHPCSTEGADQQLVQPGTMVPCQMPGLVEPPLGDMAACHYVQQPDPNFDDGSGQLGYAPAPMQMVSDASNLQWSSTVTSSNDDNCNAGYGVSPPYSSPAGRVNSASTTTTFASNASSDVIAADAAAATELLNMHLCDLLDVSDYM